jgi:hypothetical protein
MGHRAHASAEVAPVADEYRPAGHCVQLLGVAREAAYVPVGQMVHAETPPEGLKYPMAHGWHVALLLAAVCKENEPAEHAVHVVLPGVDVYVPARHAEHVAADVAPGAAET